MVLVWFKSIKLHESSKISIRTQIIGCNIYCFGKKRRVESTLHLFAFILKVQCMINSVVNSVDHALNLKNERKQMKGQRFENESSIGTSDSEAKCLFNKYAYRLVLSSILTYSISAHHSGIIAWNLIICHRVSKM